MKSEKSLLLAVAFAALAAGSAAAQSENALSSALDQARADVAASPAKPVTSCPDAQELEAPFELSVSFPDGRTPLDLSFEYDGCDQEERNDYIPPYTQRSYKGQDGYGLVIVTSDGESQSDVLVSKGQDWVGRFGTIANADLVSGNPISAGDVGIKDAAGSANGKAVLRDAAKPLYPQLKACEAADWSKASGIGAPARENGKPVTGWDGRSVPSLVLLTKTAAFYYHEDCDICAEITKCDLGSGALSSVVAAHEADCGDLTTYRSEPGIVFDACAGPR
ncbi:MAG TPA: hypothetical protein VH309_01625 [Elusimicrobiota bacterium]|jgi:hypothetical protein|nr:hypothetical protein [Elusimicrobiota bacterium]